MGKTVAVIGTFDTKAKEFLYLIRCLNEFGLSVIAIDVGTDSQSEVQPDYRAAEALDPGMRDRISKDKWMEAVAGQAVLIVKPLLDKDKIQGVISMGGGQGTFLANRIFRELPIGMPKLLMSTLALLEDSAQQFLGLNDTLVMNSLVDIAGLNSVLEENIQKAAGAMAGMISFGMPQKQREKKRSIGISCWGVTTPCVDTVREILTEKGYEVYVFHANREGGMMLERFVREGLLDGVADITLSEVSMPLADSYQKPLPDRLESAGEKGIPQVVVPGGLDMVLKHKEEAKADTGRKVYYHTPDVVFVRSNQEENKRFAETISRKLNGAKGPTVLMLPLGGISKVDGKGGIFHEPETNAVLFDTLKAGIEDNVELIEMECEITDPDFGRKIAEVLIDKVEGGTEK